MADNFVERRRHTRVRSRLPLEYKNLRESTADPKGSLIKDISEGGIRFTSDKFLSLANRLVITVNVPTTTRQIKAISKIAWIKRLPDSDKYEVGNQFLEMSREDKEEVAKYVKTITDLDITY